MDFISLYLQHDKMSIEAFGGSICPLKDFVFEALQINCCVKVV